MGPSARNTESEQDVKPCCDPSLPTSIKLSGQSDDQSHAPRYTTNKTVNVIDNGCSGSAAEKTRQS